MACGLLGATLLVLSFLMTRLALLALFSLSLGVSGLAYAKEKFQQPGPVHLDKKGEKWARESLKKDVAGAEDWTDVHDLGAGAVHQHH